MSDRAIRTSPQRRYSQYDPASSGMIQCASLHGNPFAVVIVWMRPSTIRLIPPTVDAQMAPSASR